MHCSDLKYESVTLKLHSTYTAAHFTSAMKMFVAALVGCCLVTCLLKAALEANLHIKKADDNTESSKTSPDSMLEATSTCCTCEVLSSLESHVSIQRHRKEVRLA